ncbi:hypothetical protein BU23DRAFT_167307 [Bimuria novae-zelandiae CBS 107.79]|uniref:Uncharacterized protein n=1 Tax=Bimuria novae-zelandiae CBS 107.79 TaxID=1447943 RepID=A0A6A5V500_9PLEO|nr:hypothetical protein BU23DRAFT_167307 [Bimuria novae-zelandiae CBS 107.79]
MSITPLLIFCIRDFLAVILALALRQPMLVYFAGVSSVLPVVPASSRSVTAVFTRNIENFQLTRDTSTSWIPAQAARKAPPGVLCERLRGNIGASVKVSDTHRTSAFIVFLPVPLFATAAFYGHLTTPARRESI